MYRRSALLALGGLAASSCLPTFKGGGGSAAPPGGAVRFAWADVGYPTPFRVSAAGPGGAVLLSLLYDTLTWKDQKGIIPWLGTGCDVSSDGREYTFSLAQDAHWQDGQPLTAADVAFSFNYYRRHPFRWMSTAMVDSATAIGSASAASPGLSLWAISRRHRWSRADHSRARVVGD